MMKIETTLPYLSSYRFIRAIRKRIIESTTLIRMELASGK